MIPGRYFSGRQVQTLFRETYMGWTLRSLGVTHVFSYNDEDCQIVSEKHHISLDSDQDSGSTKAENPFLVRFNPEHDVGNPRHWPIAVKVIATAVINLVTVACYMGASLWSSSTEGFIEAFGISQTVANLGPDIVARSVFVDFRANASKGTSLYLFGLAIGGMLFSPICELPQVGKTHVYIPALTAYLLCLLPILLSDSVAVILVFRFITGFLASPTVSLGGASVADVWEARNLGPPMIIYDGATAFATFIGPVMGNWAAQLAPGESYRWPMWINFWFSAIALIACFFFLPETSPSTILHWRASRIRMRTGDDRYHTKGEVGVAKRTTGAWMERLFVKPITLNFKEPIVLVLNSYLALVYALLFAALESFRIVYVDIYGFTPGQEGLTFIAPFVGFVLSQAIYFAWYQRYQEPEFEQGTMKPERRLLPAFCAAFTIPIGLFWFGWSAQARVHPVMPIIGGAFLGPSTLCLFAATLNYLPDAYPEVASTVLAGSNFTRCALAGIFPFFITPLYKAIGPGWASSIWALVGVIFMPAPFLIYRYGAWLRAKSPNATKDFV